MPLAATPRQWHLHAGLLVVWFVASFGVVFFARDLQFSVAGWPFGFWFAAQGSVLVFLAIVVAFAWVANRREAPEPGFDYAAYAASKRRLHWRFAFYVAGMLAFLLLLALAELPPSITWLGGVFRPCITAWPLRPTG
jgi:cation/acetate symporter